DSVLRRLGHRTAVADAPPRRLRDPCLRCLRSTDLRQGRRDPPALPGVSMSVASQPVGRRERNKQVKLARIMAAASELFAEHGVDEVTTQQIADKADIGTG